MFTRRLWLLCAVLPPLTLIFMVAPVLAVTTIFKQDNARQILDQSWRAYKDRFMQFDGRVFDPDAGSITTSEGQSYALLRAAWQDDKAAFATIWKWTADNLGYRANGCFAWKWGQRCDKSWGIIDPTWASDADQDIALALIIAASRFKNPEYMQEAKAVLAKIWEQEVVAYGGKPYLLPAPWAKDMACPRLNPSYMAPYAYRIFARVDAGHDWQGLVETAYDVVEKASRASRLGLPPDWCYLDPATLAVTVQQHDALCDYSYDAMRTPWRIFMDWQWNHEARAKSYLESLSFLPDSWLEARTLRAAYSPAGVMRSFDEPLAGFACVLPLFALTAPDLARQMLQERITPRFYDGLWHPDKDYYGQNWAWFGIAAANNLLPAPAVK